MSASDSISITDRATLSISPNENFILFGIIGIIIFVGLALYVYFYGHKETCAEIGKACLNLAVGVFLVGIFQPYLKPQNQVDLNTLGIAGLFFSLFGAIGIVCINKGGTQNAN